ncbi:uncharacterized protein IAS62_004386 [Cryptococcus decagattii]|uniref:Kinetochore protein SPC25 n=1 Tax=Cryptococcus decagattii TaxID=1859122 RepID=A0ABZ2B0R2_9TREE
MAPTTYIVPPRPASLHSLLESSTSKNGVPSLDLRWEPFQRHIESFLNAIDAYTQAARTEIVARATDHTAAVRDLKADKEEMEKGIQLQRESEGEMLATLEAERHVVADLVASLSHLQSSLTKIKEKSSILDTELQSERKEVTAMQAEKERQTNVLNDMRGKDTTELKQLEEALGWKVEGIKQDQLLMRFTLLDPEDPAREFSIIVDVSKQDYSVPNCDPPIPSLPDLVRQLNFDRDLFAFIKRVRKAFRALIPNPPNPSTKFDDLTGPGLLGLRTPARNSRTLLSTTPAMSNSAMDSLAMDQLALGR